MIKYKDIQATFKKKYGITIKTCWIADVKRQMGFKVREAHNRQGNKIINECKKEYIQKIKDIINGK
ncbi:MAG: hypothetical protein QM528_02825 [Phycisphaerales bacterium]|nr:hypothetical protein [Phycisphaerales bacterium]